VKKPTRIWLNGRVAGWHEATVHVTSETAIRGVNVFEGVMAYKVPGRDEHAVIAIDEHLARLERSAALLHLPVPYSSAELRQGVADLIRAEPSSDDLYIRPTVYLDRGMYTGDLASMHAGAYITSYTRTRASMKDVDLVSVPHRRIDDETFPVQAKSGAVYSAFRLARIAAVQAGGQEPLLLNGRGTVAETAGAAVMAVFGDEVVSPPAADGALESITRDILAGILRDEFGKTLVLRSLNPGDLYEADEVFLCGTLDEVVSVRTYDGERVGKADGDLALRLFEKYREACTVPSGTGIQMTVTW